MKGWIVVAACVAALVAGAPAAAQRTVAARVNGTAILLDRVDRQFEELLRERRLNIARMTNPAQARGLKREALDSLIRVELLWQEAQQAGLAAGDDEVERALADFRKGFRTEEAYQARLDRTGFTEAEWRAHVRKLLSGERYAQRVVEREVKVSEQDIEDFYAINPRLFTRPEQVKVRQILIAVPHDASPEVRQRARERIEAFAARVRAGESFDELARRHSDDATRQWGGEMDPFARGESHKAFEDAAFALAVGQVSAPVETPVGFHLIRLEEKLPAVATPLAQVRERIRDHLRTSRGKEAIAREVEQLRGIGKVEVLMPL